MRRVELAVGVVVVVGDARSDRRARRSAELGVGVDEQLQERVQRLRSAWLLDTAGPERSDCVP